jgi:hypothetical protein
VTKADTKGAAKVDWMVEKVVSTAAWTAVLKAASWAVKMVAVMVARSVVVKVANRAGVRVSWRPLVGMRGI